jgi:hypothetical protein
MKIILKNLCTLDGYIIEENTKKLSNFGRFDIFSQRCKIKLKKYHKNVGNLTLHDILKKYE